MINLPKVTVYPTTQIIKGEITIEEYIKRSAKKLYEEWVYDRRWSPEDICKLVMYQKEYSGKYD